LKYGASSRERGFTRDEGVGIMQQQVKRLSLLLTTIALIAAMTSAADSDAVLGINVTPAKFEAAMTPGSTYNLPITVNNTSFSSTHILASLSDFGLNENGDYEFERAGTRPTSVLRWAAIKPREFDIPPNSIQQVQLTLTIPDDKNLSGEYAGVVFFQTRPERGKRGVMFSARVATKLYITIQGTEKIDGAITKMTSTKAPSGQMYRVLFKNTGNTHVYCRGDLIVQKNGSVVYQMPLPANLLVERGGERIIQALGKPLSPGTYQAIATVDYGGKTETGGEINFVVH
jgi:hypothetical protein